ncbi:hypothetical protein LZ31DRAFT_103735 [Colletotrichum somersetense]|nr:hypothetical protein LZ31DRAFT_103735 [Colletotrichum somersetense]
MTAPDKIANPLGRILLVPSCTTRSSPGIFLQHHSIMTGIRQSPTPSRRRGMAPATFNGSARFILLGLARLEPWHAHWHTMLTFILDNNCLPHILLKDKVHVPPIPRLPRRTGEAASKGNRETRRNEIGTEHRGGLAYWPSDLRYVHSSALRAALLHATACTRLDLTAFGLAILQPLKFSDEILFVRRRLRGLPSRR